MNNKMIYRLKEFYILETFQVAFYQAQLSISSDEYYNKAFEKMIQIESAHADFFAQKLLKANQKVPTLTGSVFELAGRFVGETAEATGHYNSCKLGVALENKAMKKYRTFISESKENNQSILRETLLEYLVDEEFHTLWLINYMNKYNK